MTPEDYEQARARDVWIDERPFDESDDLDAVDDEDALLQVVVR